MTSEFGTDLRAVRPRGTGCRECLPRRVDEENDESIEL